MPKSPESAIIVVMAAVVPFPETGIVTDGVTESSLGIVRIADLLPALDGVKRTSKGKQAPAATVTA